MAKKPVVGDRVRYASAFLRNLAIHTGPAPERRGTLVGVAMRDPDGRTMARVLWDASDDFSVGPEDGSRVLLSNLERAG